MLAIIGTYRGLEYTPRLLASLKDHVSGITETVFVDDSGDAKVRKALKAWGDVHEVADENAGYNAAMQVVVNLGQDYGDHAAFIEEDFVFTGTTDFARLASHIDSHPYLSQVVLQRPAWFPVELRAGSMLKVHTNRGKLFREVHDFLEHEHFFSCNPAVWNIETFRAGWPVGEWSENLKRDEELAAGRKFAITKDIRVMHDGVRSGKDY